MGDGPCGYVHFYDPHVFFEKRSREFSHVGAYTHSFDSLPTGAIARQIIDELESMGCNTMEGGPDNIEAIEAFAGRSLSDYYTEGLGTGLSFQELPGQTLVTTSAPVIQQAEPGNHYAP